MLPEKKKSIYINICMYFSNKYRLYQILKDYAVTIKLG